MITICQREKRCSLYPVYIVLLFRIQFFEFVLYIILIDYRGLSVFRILHESLVSELVFWAKNSEMQKRPLIS